MSTIHRFDGFMIDLDGTVYRGDELIPGADAAIHALLEAGKRIVFVSNRGNYSQEMCHNKLQAMGIRVSADSILLTSTASAMYLKQHHPHDPLWVLGEVGLRQELQRHDLVLATTPNQAKWLVITLHETLTYQDLNLAFRAVRHGARIIATNADRMVPTDEGDCLDVAGMIGAIAYATGQEPDVIIGKPSSYMAHTALGMIDVSPSRCLVIGDSLHSDIALGKNHGMSTALVLSGSATRDDAASADVQPDFIWSSLAEIQRYL